MKEVHYRVSTPVLGGFPGHHRSPRGDSGFEMRGHAALIDAPDPRRLDLHASLRDPFGDWRVRVYSQRKSVPVVVLADLSASMGFIGQRRRVEVMADFVASLAWSAWRTGDSFGFVGCDAVVRQDWLQFPSRSRAAGQVLAERLRQWTPEAGTARSAAGLLEAGPFLGRRRALVFLLSDFHLPQAQLEALPGRLAGHEVVPVVLWDAQEADLGARSGVAEVHDPESGRQRLLWWRPLLRERRQRAWAERRAALQQWFGREHMKPLFIEQGFDADAVTRHFHAG